MIKFDNTYPIVRNSKLFSGRYERNFILRSGAINALIPQIQRLFPNNKETLEILATTYFEPVLVFQPEKSCVVRFRQRVEYDKSKKFSPPKNWLLSGAGSFEIKIKNLKGKNKGKVQKMATFLPDKKDRELYTLLQLVKTKHPKEKAIIKFINDANFRQKTESTDKYLQLINPDILLKTIPFLSLCATRVNIRHSYDIQAPKPIRITIETHPRFYVYPIDHLANIRGQFVSSYKGLGTESPHREKVEIKAINEILHKRVLFQLMPFLKSNMAPGNKYTNKPYYKMIVEASELAGVLINEAPTREIEIKANLIGKINISHLIEKIWIFLLKSHTSPYKLYPTEPVISLRGEAELNRTIFGWKNNLGVWEEAATIIRMTDNGTKEYGFATIIKRKTDYRNKKDPVLNRKEVHEYLKKNISNKTFLKKLRAKTHKQVEIVGVTHKLKYRVYIQNDEGRVFCLSVDECKVKNSPRILRQLEIEYMYTISIGSKKTPARSLSRSCEECMLYFISVLSKMGIQAIQTSERKIDFVAN